MNNPDHLKTWNLYQAAWSAVPDRERRHLIEQSVSQNCVYTDPGSQAHGIDELIKRIEESQRTFPGAHFHNDDFLEHHDQGLFHWTMFDGENHVFVKGSSFGRFEDELLVRATGFFKTPGQ